MNPNRQARYPRKLVEHTLEEGVESVNTEEQTIDLDGVDGTTEESVKYSVGTGADYGDRHQKTQVGTSTTTIISQTNNNSVAALALISGKEDTDTAPPRFVDLVLYGDAIAPTVVSSGGAGGPSGRSYSLASDGMELAMGAETYLVGVRLMEVSAI